MATAALGALILCPAACALGLLAMAFRRRRAARSAPMGGGPSGSGGQLGGDREPRRPIVPVASGAAAAPLPDGDGGTP
jgi:hypothetical protein